MLTTEQKNRIAVRAMAVACFNAPIREGETNDDALNAIVKKMEGSWPVHAQKVKAIVEDRAATA